jgi:hypothetical protein
MPIKEEGGLNSGWDEYFGEENKSISGIEARFLGNPVRTLILISTEISQILGVLYTLLQCAYNAI